MMVGPSLIACISSGVGFGWGMLYWFNKINLNNKHFNFIYGILAQTIKKKRSKW